MIRLGTLLLLVAMTTFVSVTGSACADDAFVIAIDRGAGFVNPERIRPIDSYQFTVAKDGSWEFKPLKGEAKKGKLDAEDLEKWVQDIEDGGLAKVETNPLLGALDERYMDITVQTKDKKIRVRIRPDEKLSQAIEQKIVEVAKPIRPTSSGSPVILLFNGAGTSPNDVAALERILNENHLGYATANSREMNVMSESQLRAYRLLIVPGGNFETIGNGLTPAATTNVRNAVRSGLNYFGICAGAFFAGNSPYNGLNLTSGVRFPFYAAESQGIRKDAVKIAIAGSPALDQYWEDGPQLTGWGGVVAKYPDGTPAIVEGNFGRGWVILSGIHAEAPESWRRGMNFTTSAGIDNTYAVTLIRAALNGRQLEHY